MIKVGVLGCGGIAQVHGTVLKSMENVEIVACCDIKRERAEQFSKDFGGTVYIDIEELLEKEDVDTVHICLPHFLHVPVTLLALKKNIRVFMEKPPVISKEQYEDLKKVATDKNLAFCFQNRYNPCTVKAKELIESGLTGKVLGTRGIVNWHREAPYYTESGWRGVLKTEGGGVLINQSIHTLDLMTYLTGEPVLVESSIMNHHLKSTIEVEDTMETYIQYDNGAIGNFYATTSYIYDEKPIIEVHCENMTLRMEDPDLWMIYPDGTREQVPLEKLEFYGKAYWGAGHAVCIRKFYDSLEKNETFETCFSKVETITKLLLASYESAREGKVVILN